MLVPVIAIAKSDRVAEGKSCGESRQVEAYQTRLLKVEPRVNSAERVLIQCLATAEAAGAAPVRNQESEGGEQQVAADSATVIKSARI